MNVYGGLEKRAVTLFSETAEDRIIGSIYEENRLY